MLIKLYRQNQLFGLVLVFLTLLIYLICQLINNRFGLVDYEVYYRTASRIIEGETLFSIQDGHFTFKYSPVAAIYFIPFIFIPFSVSKYIFWLLLSLNILVLHWISKTLVGFGKKSPDPVQTNTLILLAALCLSDHYMFDLALGQVNFIIFSLYSLTVLFYVRGMDSLWPLPVALSLFLKPFGLIFIPYFLLKRKYRSLLLLIVYTLLLAIIPIFFYDFDGFAEQYRQWFYQLTHQLSSEQNLLDGGNLTIFSVLVRYTPLRLLNLSDNLVIIYQIIVVLLLCLFTLWFINRKTDAEFPEIADLALLMAIVPFLAYTNTNSFGALFLILYFLLINFREQKLLFRILTITGMVLTGGNIYEVWGPGLFTLFRDLSLLTVGAILLIVSFVLLRVRKVI